LSDKVTLKIGDDAAYIGHSVRRVEDDRFLMGQGNYVDDAAFPNTAHAAFIRSPHAHAKITRIDKESVMEMPGVLLILTGKDWLENGLGELPCLWQVDFSDGRRMNEITRPALALDKVCHVGDTVAAIVAESLSEARDAADALQVMYEPLPVVVDTASAVQPDAHLVHPEIETNLVFDIELGNVDDVATAMDGAAHVTHLDVVNNRIAPAPMEPRALIGNHQRGDDSYTLWGQSQNPHLLRQWIADNSLQVPEHKVRVVSPDVGGGFGQKIYHYPEEATILLASRLLGRPVRWTATRSDNFIVDTYARDHVTQCAMAFDGDGKILAIDIDTIANIGGYLSGMGAGIPGAFYPPHITGLYDIPAARCRVRAIYSNTTPVDAYRGAGQPEAAFTLERLLDKAAREMKIDPLALRARNVMGPERFPFSNPIGRLYDNGDYPGLIKMLKDVVRYEDLRMEQRQSRDDGLCLGVGISGVVESTGAPSSRNASKVGRRIPTYDSASARVHPSGKVTIFCGGHSHGQGHATTFAQIAAEMLGCDLSSVEIIEGDTDRTPFGLGTFGSRTLLTAGVAITHAVDKVIKKGLKIAAHLMECDAKDVVFESGQYTIVGTNRSVEFVDVANAAYRLDNYPLELEPGLEEIAFYDPPGRATTSGIHLCVVLVDPVTGSVRLRNYWSIDDVGRVINPMIVEGQIHGGVAQGVGQALLEHCVFDDSGQMLTGSFMDYAMPRADNLPAIGTEFQETLCLDNPLGAKGVGESGAIGAPPAVVNAVVDALSAFSVHHIDMPLTSERVWRAIRAADDSTGVAGA